MKDLDADRVLEIGIEEPLGQRVPAKKIFVRECYKRLESMIWDAFLSGGRVEVALTGTPGIGKSLFGLYFLFKLVRFLKAEGAGSSKVARLGRGLNGIIIYEHVVHASDSPVFYLIDVAAGTVHKYNVDQQWADDPRALLIKDGPCKGGDVLCSVLWVSSPRAGSFYKFREYARCFVMPPWTADELVDCWKHGCLPFILEQSHAGQPVRLAASEAVEALDSDASEDAQQEAMLRRWAGDYGPVPRRLRNPVKAHELLQGALAELGNEDLQRLSRIAQGKDRGSGPGNRFKLSHRLLLMIPMPDLIGTFSLIPSSVHVGRNILQLHSAANLLNAQELMGRIAGAHLGLVFEPYAHHVLASGGSWRIRSLAAGGGHEVLHLDRHDTVDVRNDQVAALAIEDRKYYVPTDPTYAVVDAWSGINMFQITVSDHHPIKSGAKQYKALEGKGLQRLIFVVPEKLALQFQRQPLVDAKGKVQDGGPRGGWNDVPQFVLGL